MQVLEVDPHKRRISLGLKQTLDNPWDDFLATHPVGSEVEGEVKNKTEFGLFIGLERRCRRHGSPVGSRLEPFWRRSHRGIQQGRHGEGRGA